jgi:hypothetical protein
MNLPVLISSSDLSGRKMRSPIPAILAAALFLLIPRSASSHDIPDDVTVQAFVKPSGEHLYVLVRVPLNAMRDTEFPEHGPGYLDLDQVEPSLREAATVWISEALELYQGDTQLPKPQIAEARVSLPSDRSFGSYQAALEHVQGPRLPNDTQLYWNQAMLDVLLEYPIQPQPADFSVHSGLARLGLRVVTVVRFLPGNDTVRAYEFTGDPGLVRLDPHWYQAGLSFVDLGFWHILGGTDHLLFLFCLVIPFRRFRALIPVVSAFTVAHSITLFASAYNLAPDALWFPPLIETLIAISIVYMALENIVGGAGLQRRWMMAFGFGLVHGFGFSFALRQTMQFAGSHLLASLLSFNIGVELGQLLVLALLVPLLEIFFRFAVAERTGTIILSALVADTAWHWTIERAARLSEYRFASPLLNAAMLATILQWLTLMVLATGLIWLARKLGLRSWPWPERPQQAALRRDMSETGAAPSALEIQTGGGEL